MSTHEIWNRLHAGLSTRRTVQQVVYDLNALGLLVPDEMPRDVGISARALLYAANHFPMLMRTIYAEHPGLHRPYATAARLMQRVADATRTPHQASADPADAAALAEWVLEAKDTLSLPSAPNTSRRASSERLSFRTIYGEEALTPEKRHRPVPPRSVRHGHADFRQRLTATERRAELPGVSKKLYKAAVRSVLHLEERVATLLDVRRMESNVQFAKARLAPSIPRQGFEASPYTAAFVAYYTARLGARTLFSAAGQDRPMDDVAEHLLQQALPEGNFATLSKVITHRAIVRRLSGDEVIELERLYLDRIDTAAYDLARLFDHSRDRREMIVRRGDDSSTWNAASRAFNQARTGLLNLAPFVQEVRGAVGPVFGIDYLPGKAPALIAADVANYLYEGELHADLQVWDQLPLPWQALPGGSATCTVEDVQHVCASLGIDADTTGWTMPYRQDRIETARPAQDLVHGIAVHADPALVEELRKAGLFAGKRG